MATRAPRRSAPAPAAAGSDTAPAGAASPSAFFRHLVWNMRNGIIAIDRTGGLVIVNDEARRIFGLALDATAVGVHFSVLLEHHPDIVRVLAGVFDLKHLPDRAEIRLPATGTVLGYTLSHVRDDDNEMVGAALLFKDLTQVEQMEERERLRDRLAAVGEMAAVMAHEIRNPLAAIEILAGLLRRRDPDSAEVQGLVGDIIGEAKMANAIVQEVLEFVRPVRLQVDRTSLSNAVASAVTLADSKGPHPAIALTVSIPEQLPAVRADLYQLTQVFANLLLNAYEAIEGPGRVTVSARVAVDVASGALSPDGRQPVPTVVVDVADDGPGISDEVAARIFNPFFTTKPQGSGLGLAIVRKIVDAHEGRIDMTSQVGGGTCFRVMLPVDQAPLRIDESAGRN